MIIGFIDFMHKLILGLKESNFYFKFGHKYSLLEASRIFRNLISSLKDIQRYLPLYILMLVYMKSLNLSSIFNTEFGYSTLLQKDSVECSRHRGAYILNVLLVYYCSNQENIVVCFLLQGVQSRTIDTLTFRKSSLWRVFLLTHGISA